MGYLVNLTNNLKYHFNYLSTHPNGDTRTQMNHLNDFVLNSRKKRLSFSKNDFS